MKRPWFIPLVLAGLLAGLTWLGSQRVAATNAAPSGDLPLAGRVRANRVVVRAPSLVVRKPTTASQPSVAGTLASVEVSAGAHVVTGQVIARMDDASLALGVRQAEAVASGARARIGIVNDKLEVVADNASDLADARRKLNDALAKLRSSRKDVVSNLEQARALAASLPPGFTPPPGTTDPRVLVAKLEGALAQIDAGIAKATAGRKKLDSGSAKLTDARSQLRGAHAVLVLAADAADTGVDVAEARRALATIRAPFSGLVTWTEEPGTVVFAGGPLVTLAPDGPLLLDAYVDAEQAGAVRLGARTDATADSWPARIFPGRVTQIRPVYEYPPTALPTSLVHMTRAFRVTVTVDDSSAPLPAGTPVDLTISMRSE